MKVTSPDPVSLTITHMHVCMRRLLTDAGPGFVGVDDANSVWVAMTLVAMAGEVQLTRITVVSARYMQHSHKNVRVFIWTINCFFSHIFVFLRLTVADCKLILRSISRQLVSYRARVSEPPVIYEVWHIRSFYWERQCYCDVIVSSHLICYSVKQLSNATV